jgi:hypothetical protein
VQATLDDPLMIAAIMPLRAFLQPSLCGPIV